MNYLSLKWKCHNLIDISMHEAEEKQFLVAPDGRGIIGVDATPPLPLHLERILSQQAKRPSYNPYGKN